MFAVFTMTKGIAAVVNSNVYLHFQQLYFFFFVYIIFLKNTIPKVKTMTKLSLSDYNKCTTESQSNLILRYIKVYDFRMKETLSKIYKVDNFILIKEFIQK